MKKIIIAFVLGICVSLTTVYAVDAYIESNKVTYTNHNKTNVEEAIDELYEISGIHKEKWIDPVLNGADPVLKDPLIPVDINPNGDVYYANLNSEWYNYGEKKWANAVILIDNPSNTNYVVGDHILENDIESYFVWIPRYKYKVWDLGKYNGIINSSQITNDANNPTADTSLWKVAGNNSKLIDIVFGDSKYVNVENGTVQGSGISGGDANVKVGDYLIHPAFKLGTKELNGIWVGKFETGGTSASDMVIKPDVVSWCNISVKNIFMTAYEYEKGNNQHNEILDPHMMKNTEWGAVVYLINSSYGKGGEVNTNNNSELKTGYSATANADQSTYPGITGQTSEKDKTQPWNSSVGYLASTTGNISGIYDMSGGAWEFMAACVGDAQDGNFEIDELNQYMSNGYIEKYLENSTITSYNNRILGDATGETGPFYAYFENGGSSQYHNSWFADSSSFLTSNWPWFIRGTAVGGGVISGPTAFIGTTGNAIGNVGFRISFAPTNN